MRSLGIARTEVVDVGAEDPIIAAARIGAMAGVDYAEPNYVFEGAAPSDERFPDEWGLNNTGQRVFGQSGRPDADIDAPEAWETTEGSTDVLVAVVDSGVAMDHPDLAAAQWINPGESAIEADRDDRVDDDGNGFVDDWRGWDFVAADNRPDDQVGHGTHVAGTIGAAIDGQGIVGVSPQVSLLSVRVLDESNSGSLADIAAGMHYAGAMGARVANVSIQASVFSRTMKRAIDAHPDTLFAIAAGNGGPDGRGDDNDIEPTYPCAYGLPNIVCVAATDQNDRLTGFSNRGVKTVDLAAPGLSVLSDRPEWGSPFSEYFDQDIEGRWMTGGRGTEWGWSTNRFNDGRLEDSPDGRYKRKSNAWARTGSPIDLSGMRNCVLFYDLRLRVARGDRLLIEASRDGTSFKRLTKWAFSTRQWYYGNELSLERYDGDPAVHLRFRLKANDKDQADGAKIDNLYTRCFTADYGDDPFVYMSGTSMATPHVAGTAALLWAVAPEATVAEIKNLLLAGVDRRPDLWNAVRTGGRVNAARSLALATAGPGQPPAACAEGELPLITRTSPSSAPAAVDFEADIYDSQHVFDEVDAAYSQTGLHVAGATGDDLIRYFDPSGVGATIARLELASGSVSIGVPEGGDPLIGFHDRLIADDSGEAVMCEANVIIDPAGNRSIVDAKLGMDGSYAIGDIAIDDSNLHRAFTVGSKDRLFYGGSDGVENLGVSKIRSVKVAANGGAVVIGAYDGKTLRLFTRTPGGWTSSVRAHRVGAWDLDVGSDGTPRVAWTTTGGQLRLFNGVSVSKPGVVAEVVAVAAEPGTHTMHVAFGTYERCGDIGCKRVAYLQKAPGSDAQTTRFEKAGYVTDIAIAIGGGEVAIVYGDPTRAGALIVRRASL